MGCTNAQLNQSRHSPHQPEGRATAFACLLLLLLLLHALGILVGIVCVSLRAVVRVVVVVRSEINHLHSSLFGVGLILVDDHLVKLVGQRGIGVRHGREQLGLNFVDLQPAATVPPSPAAKEETKSV